ncbi:MAG: hypothetical protein WCY36_02095 [Candidatus Omnitrophota bacterium]
MRRALLLVLCCVLLSSCETIKEIRENDTLNKLGSFRLNSVRPNSYWYDGKSYEYNQYEIDITSAPGRAHIILNDKYIGDTPFKYSFTGTVDRDERLTFRIMPFDEKMKPQGAVLRIREELPRQIFFDLNSK